MNDTTFLVFGVSLKKYTPQIDAFESPYDWANPVFIETAVRGDPQLDKLDILWAFDDEESPILYLKRAGHFGHPMTTIDSLPMYHVNADEWNQVNRFASILKIPTNELVEKFGFIMGTMLEY